MGKKKMRKEKTSTKINTKTAKKKEKKKSSESEIPDVLLVRHSKTKEVNGEYIRNGNSWLHDAKKEVKGKIKDFLFEIKKNEDPGQWKLQVTQKSNKKSVTLYLTNTFCLSRTVPPSDGWR